MSYLINTELYYSIKFGDIDGKAYIIACSDSYRVVFILGIHDKTFYDTCTINLYKNSNAVGTYNVAMGDIYNGLCICTTLQGLLENPKNFSMIDGTFLFSYEGFVNIGKEDPYGFLIIATKNKRISYVEIDYATDDMIYNKKYKSFIHIWLKPILKRFIET